MTVEQHITIISAGSRVAYQLCVVAAMLVGGWLIRRDARQWKLPIVQYWAIILVALSGALIGCTIPAFVAGGFVEEAAWTLPVTPKTIMGGVLFSFLAVAAFKQLLGNHYDTSDAFARGAILMMAIGRIGCIFQHCCYGKAAAWGFDFGDGIRRIPVQYMEAMGLFLIAYAIHYLHIHKLLPGRRLFLVFIAYGVLRFCMEFLREPIAGEFLGLGFYHWLAALIFFVGLFQFIKRSARTTAFKIASA